MLNKVFWIFTVFFIFNYINVNAQTYQLSGTLFDAKTFRPISYASVKLSDNSFITSTDASGHYILYLKKGSHKIIYSMIGYFSESNKVSITDSSLNINIYLKPSEIFTEEIEVYGEDPAYEIMRKAIKYKKNLQANLNEYEYNAYTKYVIRTNLNLYDEKKKDTLDGSSYNILALLESETKGYFKKPDIEKQIVLSKKETANTIRGVALPLIVNFYDENVEMEVENGNKIKIPTPVSDDAFDNYDFVYKGNTSLDSNKIFKIEVKNKSSLKPQFYGNIYIKDSIYSLAKVDLFVNDAGNPSNIDKLKFIQKFDVFEDKNKLKFWFPVDVEILAEGSFMSFIKFQGEVFTIITNYDVNKPAPPGIFDDFIIKVLPDAVKDSIYWAEHRLIRNTNDEIIAYRNIENKVNENKKGISFGFETIKFGENFSMKPLELYRFNRVEGSRLQFNLDYNKDFGKVFINSNFGYGLSDKKTKYDIYVGFNLLKDRSLRFNAKIFRELNVLSASDYGLYGLYNTMTSLFYKHDTYDYFYSSGYNLSVSKLFFSNLRLGLLYNQAKQTSAINNSDFSFFKKSKSYRVNPPILDYFKRTIGFYINYDFSSFKYIDWGTGEISRIRMSNLPGIQFTYNYSGKSLNSQSEFRKYDVLFYGQNSFHPFINLSYNIGGTYINGDVPFQELAFFKNRFDATSRLAFTSMIYQEFLGDKIYFLNLKNDFGKLPITSAIPFLKNMRFVGMLNIGRSEISNSNRQLNSFNSFNTTKGYYSEAGFGFERFMDFINIYFTWRLNNFNQGNNFMLSFGSEIF